MGEKNRPSLPAEPIYLPKSAPVSPERVAGDLKLNAEAAAILAKRECFVKKNFRGIASASAKQGVNNDAEATESAAPVLSHTNSAQGEQFPYWSKGKRWLHQRYGALQGGR
jgi:hypothetical protein